MAALAISIKVLSGLLTNSLVSTSGNKNITAAESRETTALAV